MAKVKQNETAVFDLNALIKKDFGNVVCYGTDIKTSSNTIIKTSPSLDQALGGGIPMGSRVILGGKPKCGKTTLGLQLLANAQKMGFPAFLISVEGRIKTRDLEGINGLDLSTLQVVKSEEGHILSGNDFLEITTKIIHNVKNAAILIDSYSALSTSNILQDDKINDSRRLTRPRLLADFINKNSQIIPVNKILLIGIAHEIANTSGYGPSKMLDGGNKIQYDSDIKMIATAVEFWEQKIDGEEKAKTTGQSTKWNIDWSSLGGPKCEAVTHLRYGYGIDTIKDIFQTSVLYGVVIKAGSWYSFGDDFKFQGEDKFINAIQNDKDRLEQLNKGLELVMYGN